ncbi:DUF2293 domain-containing protein [Hyphomonas pacifica]|uniref:DUF2293 domain-containing protein n=1 Tax=Hyphomonas pacifica TaxID=1280941 RepID=UPI00387E745E
MAKHFPFCPVESIDEIVVWVTDRSWTKRTRIVTAVSIAVHTHIRHRHTDYERHLKIHRMTRDEARQIVQNEVNDIFTLWHLGACVPSSPNTHTRFLP